MNIVQQLKDAEGNNIYPIGYSLGGVKMVLLWTKASPTSTFSSQTIPLDLSTYTGVIIYLCGNASNNTGAMSVHMAIFLKVGDDFVIKPDDGYDANNLHTYKATTTGVIVDGVGTYYSEYKKPYKIYGIKTAWVVPTSVHGLQYVEV